ncbi:MAG: (2Fe-2S)-binding protein [Pseudomonadota bacterium]
MKKHTIHVTVNGEPQELQVEPNELLLTVVRERLGLTGTKYACGTGQCGACTVVANDEPVLGCLTLAVALDGAKITTIEGLARPDGTLDPLQTSFLDSNAVQCGFCTPGMILVGRDLLNKNPSPTEQEVRTHIKGNICRCTGYDGIVRAIKSCTEKSKTDC